MGRTNRRSVGLPVGLAGDVRTCANLRRPARSRGSRRFQNRRGLAMITLARPVFTDRLGPHRPAAGSPPARRGPFFRADMGLRPDENVLADLWSPVAGAVVPRVGRRVAETLARRPDDGRAPDVLGAEVLAGDAREVQAVRAAAVAQDGGRDGRGYALPGRAGHRPCRGRWQNRSEHSPDVP